MITGDRDQHAYRTDDFSAYFRYVRARFDARISDGLANGPAGTYPDPVDHCRVCTWYPMCIQRRRDDDHLSIVAGMRRVDTERLTNAGVSTLAGLAALGPDRPIEGIAGPQLTRIREQSRLQLHERVTHERVFELIPPDPDDTGRGLRALPEPSPWDLFFDIEADPWATEVGLEYLLGVVEEVDGQPALPRYLGDLARGRESRVRAVHPARHRAPGRASGDARLPLRRIRSGRHQAPHAAARDMRRRGRPTASGRRPRRPAQRRAAGCSCLGRVVLAQADREVLHARRARGRSPRPASAWSPSRRGSRTATRRSSTGSPRTTATTACRPGCCAAGSRSGVRRPSSAGRSSTGRGRSGRRTGPSPAVTDWLRAVEERVAGLTTDLAADDHSPEAEGRRLLADLIDWHRREEKSQWWRWFELKDDLTIEQLVIERDALAGLVFVDEFEGEGVMRHRRYRFEPQDHGFDPGDEVFANETGKATGTIVSIDDAAGHHRAQAIAQRRLAASARPDRAGPARQRPPETGDAPGRRFGHRERHRRRAAPTERSATCCSASRRAGRLDRGARLVEPGEDVLDAARRLALELDDGHAADPGAARDGQDVRRRPDDPRPGPDPEAGRGDGAVAQDDQQPPRGARRGSRRGAGRGPDPPEGGCRRSVRSPG